VENEIREVIGIAFSKKVTISHRKKWIKNHINKNKPMIFVVRHAESEANVGLATSNPEKISITKSGEDLSAKFADEIEINPDLIVISRHYRTLQTAQPLIEKYPQAILETWAIHEFTYLAPSACIDTTKEDRKTRVEEYWDKCDPDFVDGLGAESFATFFKRVQGCFNRMKVLGECFWLILRSTKVY